MSSTDDSLFHGARIKFKSILTCKCYDVKKGQHGGNFVITLNRVITLQQNTKYTNK